VAQSNDLNLELTPRSQTENDGGEQGNQDAKHESRGYQFDPVSAMFSIWMEFSAATTKFFRGFFIGAPSGRNFSRQ
jgi:hypothetical protein